MTTKRFTMGCLAAGSILLVACGAQSLCDDANNCRARDEGDESVDAGSSSRVQASPTQDESENHLHVDIVADSLAKFVGAASRDSQGRLDTQRVVAMPSSRNLLVNPGFDGTFTGWKVSTGCMLVPDSEGRSDSNAASVSSSCQPEQCVTVSSGPYVVGGRFKRGQASGDDYYFSVDYFSDQSCTHYVDSAVSFGSDATANWTDHASNVNVPSEIRSVRLQVWCLDVLVDQVFFGIPNH